MKEPTRIAQVIRLRPDMRDEYVRLHAAVWPAVLRAIEAANIRNYSIYLREPEMLLFGTFEYHGDDLACDMSRMARDPEVQRWWRLTDACQDPLDTRVTGEWWADMREVFHHGPPRDD